MHSCAARSPRKRIASEVRPRICIPKSYSEQLQNDSTKNDASLEMRHIQLTRAAQKAKTAGKGATERRRVGREETKKGYVWRRWCFREIGYAAFFSFDVQSRRQESTKKDCVGSMPLEFLLSKVTVKNFKTKTAKQKLLSNARFETLLIRLSLAFTELIGKLTGPILEKEL